VIVNDLNFVGVGAIPVEAHAPLIVDSNAVLPLSITPEFLQAITWWNAQLVERFRRVDGDEFTEHHAPEICRKASDGFAREEPFGITIAERLNHRL
jgi:hypothetical protein